MATSQQVNLYTEQFRPRVVVLPLKQILMLCVFLVAILSVLGIWLSSEAQEQELQALAQIAKAEELQSKIEALAYKVGLLKQDESLLRHNRKLSAQIKAREQMLSSLGSVAVRDSIGFSPYLIGLARQKLDQLWLRRIHIADAGNSLWLEGSTRKASLVPSYLQALNAEDIFAGHAFSVFELLVQEEGVATIDFILKSKNEAGSYLVADLNRASGLQSMRPENNKGAGNGSP